MVQWYVQARRNSDLTIVGEVDDFLALTAIRRYNGVGTWALTLRLESHHAQYFLPDSNLGYPNGILIWKDNEDGNPPVLFLSGLQRGAQWSRKADSSGPLLVSGTCDNYFLSKRLVLPTPNYVYTGMFAGVLLRYYELAEASGTVATDSGTAGQNGTYTGTPVLGAPGLIDDPTTSVSFNGSSQYVSLPTTGLAAGATAWTMGAWGVLTAYPSAGNYVMMLGWGNSGVNGGAPWIGVDSSGNANCGAFGGAPFTAVGNVQVTLNQPHMIVGTYDGTTLSVYLDGALVGTHACTLAAVASNANIGRGPNSSFYWPGQIQHAFIGVGAYNLQTIQNWWLVGTCRQAANAFSLLGFSETSVNLYNYVGANGGPNSLPAQRIIPNITMPTQYGFTGGVQNATWLGRFDNLLLMIQTMALASTPELGFQLIQVGNTLQWQTYIPRDMTATAVFELDRGNLLEYDINYQAADANFLFAGGRNGNSTSLTERMFGLGGDNTSISRFGYLEDFLDYRRTQDGPTMSTIIAAKLLELAQKRSINATIIDTPQLYYGGPGVKGYQLGDNVTVITEQGIIFKDLVREVKVELAVGKPAVITPAIGTPLTAEIISEFDQLQKRLRGDNAYIAALQAIY